MDTDLINAKVHECHEAHCCGNCDHRDELKRELESMDVLVCDGSTKWHHLPGYAEAQAAKRRRHAMVLAPQVPTDQDPCGC